MKILGLDIASNTGWCILNDGKLEKYGVIHIPSEMNLCQRISFFEMNLKQILNENNVDFCCIEDVILGISGAKTLAYLGRLNGVALLTCYNKVNNNIKLYIPGEWKSNSFDGLNGNAQKVDIQIAVCKFFNLIKDDELNNIIKPLSEIKDNSQDAISKIKILKEQVQKDKAFLNRKRKGPSTEQEKKSYLNKIEEYKKEISRLENIVDQNKKNIESIYKTVSLNIMSLCGLTCDVSDSIGIAMCGYKQLKEFNKNLEN